jgi:hypothetical protein
MLLGYCSSSKFFLIMATVAQDMNLCLSRTSPQTLRRSSEYQDDGLTYADEELILEKIHPPKNRGIFSLLALSMCFGA